MLRGVFGSGGGAAIGGGGTSSPSTIPRWTGPSTLGDSVITQSGSNIGFGLGANTPISRWHALVPNSGASPTTSDWTGSFSANGDYRSGFGFQFSAGTAASNRVACLVSNGTNTGQTVVWTADGAGNVGIGTASPAARLDVLGSTSAGYFRFKGGNTSAGYGEFQNSSGTSLGLIGNGGGGALSGGTVSDLVLRAEANLLLAIGNTERARIDSNGNIYGTSGTTGMTNGFFYIPAAAGAPTGTPTAVSGRVPMYYDTTNNQFYVYNGAWKKVTLA